MTWNEKVLKDGLIGFAAGDALGVPVEYTTRDLLAEDPVRGMRGYGTYRQPPGTWSDDTSLMLATLDSIVQMGQVHLDDMMTRYLSWYDEKAYLPYGEIFDLNTITRMSLENYRSGTAAFFCGGRSDFHNGNSALTRMLPVAYYLESVGFRRQYVDPDGREAPDDDALDLIHQVSCLTNGHYVALVSSTVYTYLARWLIRWRLGGGRPGSLRPEDLIDPFEGVIRGLRHLYLHTETSRLTGPYGGPEPASREEADGYREAWDLLDRLEDLDALRRLPIDAMQADGYCLHALETSLYCLLNSEHFEDAVLTAVNLGEDADTSGALTGALAGLLYGEGQMPRSWLEQLARRSELEQHAEVASISLYRPELRPAFMLIPWLEATSPYGIPDAMPRHRIYPLGGTGDLYLDWEGVEDSLHALINRCTLAMDHEDMAATERCLDARMAWASMFSPDDDASYDVRIEPKGRKRGTCHTRHRALADLIFLTRSGSFNRHLLMPDATITPVARRHYIRMLQETLMTIRRLYLRDRWFRPAEAAREGRVLQRLAREA